jgi:hypothetical protein
MRSAGFFGNGCSVTDRFEANFAAKSYGRRHWPATQAQPIPSPRRHRAR